MKAINNIKKDLLIKRIVFNNLLEKIKIYIKKEIYNLIKTDIEKK